MRTAACRPPNSLCGIRAVARRSRDGDMASSAAVCSSPMTRRVDDRQAVDGECLDDLFNFFAPVSGATSHASSSCRVARLH